MLLISIGTIADWSGEAFSGDSAEEDAGTSRALKKSVIQGDPWARSKVCGMCHQWNMRTNQLRAYQV
tara:strand:+ start:3374 stop:3574 length:201 start_codon:yes stop_codon:yes gene_type:complete